MASILPSPNSADSPTSSNPPPSGSSLNQTTNAPPPQSSPPPSNSSAPPPESSPPLLLPLPILNPPPPAVQPSPPTLPSSPPPSPPTLPPSPPTLPPSPPTLPSSPPPSPPTLPSSPPPPPPPLTLSPSPPPPSPQVSPPQSSPAAPTPIANSSPPPAPAPSPPLPSRGSPPKASPHPPPPPVVSPTPPPPQAANSSPPITAPASPPLVPPPSPPDSSTTPSSTSPSPASPTSPPVPPSGFPPPSIPSISPSANLIPSPPMTSTSFNGSFPGSPPPANKPTATSTQLSPNTTADSTSSTTSTGLKAGVTAIISSTMGFLALTLIILAVWRIHVRKKRKDWSSLNSATPSPFASSQNSDSVFLRSNYPVQAARSASANNYIQSPDGTIGSSRSWFTYQDLLGATGGFSADNLLGEGGFGCVYKGVLADGRVVAVKQLKAGGGQGEREFRAEVEIISRIHHRHLVSLVGYCISENQRLLVYDYVPNNTLHYHLHAEGKPVLDWASRVKVAAGAARGLAYLHEDCQPRIIHRDIKSTNILLDNIFDARVADFGLAKLALELELHTHVSTRVMGTFGYLAPEYASTGKLTEKSDVFSFGVVLLELITGRKPVDPSQPLGDESLVEWARPLLTQALEKEDFSDLVDPRLENHFTASEMFRMIEAAAACIRHLASQRPKMSQVVRALDSMDELADLSNGMKPGQSGIFSSREQSAQIRIFQRMAFGSQDYGSDIYDHSQSSWGS